MKSKRRLVTSYTTEELIAIGRKFKSRTDFKKKARSAWRASIIRGCYEECTDHMAGKQKPKGYWTLKLCQREALNYKSRYEFFKKGSAPYQAAKKKGWLDQICSHMVSDRKKNGHWNDENVFLEALEYNSRLDFCRNSPGAYGAAQKLQILNKVCSHMRRIGNLKHKCIYAHEFPDKSVYIGLTYDIDAREKDRKNDNNDAVTIHKKKTGFKSNLIKKTLYLPIDKATAKEEYYVKLYLRKGWKILNRTTTGSIGGIETKWTKSACIAVAKTCTSKKEFYENHPSAYGTVTRRGWLKHCYRHIKSDRKPPGYWDFTNIRKVALKCKSKVEFEQKYGSAYNAALNLKIVDPVCKHMKNIRRPNNYWTFDKIYQLTLKCSSKTEFRANYCQAYMAARGNNWHYDIYRKRKWKVYATKSFSKKQIDNGQTS